MRRPLPRSRSSPAYLSLYLVFFLIMFVFAISNGYLSTLIMLAAVAEPSLEDEEVEVAATCLAFYLTLGLASGSFLSFGVLALARHFM